MQVEITCRHGNIGADAHDYMARKAEKLVTYFERVTEVQVTLEFDDNRVAVEILVDAEHKHNFVAKESGDEATVTFDKSLHKMEQQIRRYKEKLQDHRRDKPMNELVNDEIDE